MTIIIRCILQKGEILYPQIYLDECLYELQMLEYNRIDISEEIDIKKKLNASKECKICHYWYFKDLGFKYELYLCNRCHGLMQKLSVLMILQLFILKEMITEFIFGIWAKRMQLT